MKYCVACKSTLSEDIVYIGDQYPSAIFPNKEDPIRERLKKSSLNVSKCTNDKCGLIQLSNPVSLDEVFARYPYESSTTISMKAILADVRRACTEHSKDYATEILSWILEVTMELSCHYLKMKE